MQTVSRSIDGTSPNLLHPLPLAYLRDTPAFALFALYDDRDEQGRSFLEVRSPTNKPADSDYGPCPYTDARSDTNKRINQGAIRCYFKNETSALGLIDDLRRETTSAAGPIDWRTMTPAERLHVLSYVGYKAPYVEIFGRLLRGERLSVPTPYSIVSKLSHGLCTLAIDVHRRLDASQRAALKSGADFYRYADTHRLLEGRTEVCAAPANTISRLIDRLAGSGGCFASEGIGSTHVAFAFLAHLTELASVTFETGRKHMWRTRRGAPSGHEQALRYPTLYTTPYPALSDRMASAGQLYGSPETAWIEMAYWRSESFDELRALHESMKDAVQALLSSPRWEPLERTAWGDVCHRMTDFLNGTNRALLQLLELNGATYRKLGTHDLEVFFGDLSIEGRHDAVH